MKKFNLTALTAAALMAGSLFASSGAMASAASEENGVTAGTACKAYSSSSEGSLKADWSTVKASSAVWVHCPGAGATLAAAKDLDVTFNLEIPVDALTDVFNCYVAEQSATGSTRKVAWKAGSDAGPTAAVVDTSTAAFVGSTAAAPVTYTGGCKLGAKHMLHSVIVKAP